MITKEEAYLISNACTLNAEMLVAEYEWFPNHKKKYS